MPAIKHVVILLLFICSIKESFSQKGIQNLIAAEKAFASYAIENNTKDAFLKNADSAAVYLNNKGDTVNALQYWNKAEKRSVKLKWTPEYAEISSSGDFGYTTGPWSLYQTSVKDTPVANGHFITIWHLDNKNQWKFLLDLGISYNHENSFSQTSSVATRVNKRVSNSALLQMIDAENSFIKEENAQRTSAYLKYLSNQSRLNKEGAIPAVTKEAKNNFITTSSSGLTFIPLGYYIAPSNDLVLFTEIVY